MTEQTFHSCWFTGSTGPERLRPLGQRCRQLQVLNRSFSQTFLFIYFNLCSLTSLHYCYFSEIWIKLWLLHIKSLSSASPQNKVSHERISIAARRSFIMTVKFKFTERLDSSFIPVAPPQIPVPQTQNRPPSKGCMVLLSERLECCYGSGLEGPAMCWWKGQPVRETKRDSGPPSPPRPNSWTQSIHPTPFLLTSTQVLK